MCNFFLFVTRITVRFNKNNYCRINGRITTSGLRFLTTIKSLCLVVKLEYRSPEIQEKNVREETKVYILCKFYP